MTKSKNRDFPLPLAVYMKQRFQRGWNSGQRMSEASLGRQRVLQFFLQFSRLDTGRWRPGASYHYLTICRKRDVYIYHHLPRPMHTLCVVWNVYTYMHVCMYVFIYVINLLIYVFIYLRVHLFIYPAICMHTCRTGAYMNMHKLHTYIPAIKGYT